MKFGSLFTGGGGFDIGAKAAGLELAWGVEYIPEIAEWCNSQLGEHVRVADILEADPADFEPVDYLHASPPCPSFSNIVSESTGETEKDIRMSAKVAEFVGTIRPLYFSLENVLKYRSSDSWKIIAELLNRHGYGVSVEYVNAANFGVPQQRKRMIVRAVRDSFFAPHPMKRTHNRNGNNGSAKWVSWWDVVNDIYEDFEQEIPAKWLVDRLKTVGYRFENDGSPQLVEGVPGGPRPPRVYECWEPGEVSKAGSGSRAGHIVVGSLVYRCPPRAQARFMTFPDSYGLPDSANLANTITGNAVPCLLAQRIVESLVCSA